MGSAVQTKGFGSAFVSAMTDDQLDAALDALREILAAPAGEAANVIEDYGAPGSRGAVPGGYARAQAKAQVEPPDEGGRRGGRPAGAQAEVKGAIAREHLISQFRRLGCRDRGGSRVCRQASRVGLRDAIEIVSARLERHAA